MSWNRKDCSPEVTVERIKHILDGIGVHTSVVSQNSYRDLWFSNRVEIDGLPGIGANGKGVNVAFTEASAYAELMERLQSGMLISECFPKKQTAHIDGSASEIFHLLNKLYTDSSVLSVSELLAIAKSYPNVLEKANYIDAKSGRSEELPEKLIRIFSGTNALAAGNTYEEAFCQGCCEAFERYAIRRLYLREGSVPNIPQEWVVHTKSYALLNEIEKKGYKIIIKDCTLGGTIPVIGLLLIDPTSSKSKLCLASDINIDIALQRCITEIFQGMQFNFVFRKYMNDIAPNDQSIWCDVDYQMEYIRTIKDGTGLLPLSVFSNDISNNKELQPFRSNVNSSEAAMSVVCEIVKKLHWRLYIKDYGFLGFPTIRLVIPGATDIYKPLLERTLPNILIALGDLKYNSLDSMKPQSLYSMLTTLGNNPIYFENFDYCRLAALVFNSTSYEKTSTDLYKYVACLAYHLGKYDQAKKYIDKSMECSNNEDLAYRTIMHLWIDGKAGNHTDEEILNAIKLISHGKLDNEVMLFVKNEISLPKCKENCTICSNAEMCCYKKWRSIMGELEKYEAGWLPFSTKESQHFIKQLHVALE